MNKNICLLMLATLTAVAMATPQVQATATLIGYFMNYWDFLLTMNTVYYCFMVGHFNVIFLNDGGAGLYQCINALVTTVTWNP